MQDGNGSAAVAVYLKAWDMTGYDLFGVSASQLRSLCQDGKEHEENVMGYLNNSMQNQASLTSWSL